MSATTAGATTLEPKGVRVARDVHVNVLLLANRSLDQLEEICRSEALTHSQYVALWTLCLADDAATGIPVSAVSDGLLNRGSRPAQRPSAPCPRASGRIDGRRACM